MPAAFFATNVSKSQLGNAGTAGRHSPLINQLALSHTGFHISTPLLEFSKACGYRSDVVDSNALLRLLWVNQLVCQDFARYSEGSMYLRTHDRHGVVWIDLNLGRSRK